jgi:peroxisomal 2,4-dienoyl-CoA reductase
MQRLVPEPVKDRLRKNIPLGRFGRIADIEKASVFLCSDAASYINGVVLVVDGGQWLAANRMVGG